MWVPFEIFGIGFWVSYIFEVYIIYLPSFVNVCNDTLILGFVVQVCSQLEILNYRHKLLTEISNKKVHKRFSKLKKLEEENKLLIKNIQHHNHLLE